MKKHILFLLIVCLLGCFLPNIVLGASAASYSGECGENLTWTLDTDSGILTISGSGSMKNYSGNSPWYSYRDSITTVQISNGVTSIGSQSFRNSANLKSVSIPNSVTSIGTSAFRYCSGLTSVIIPGSVASIGDCAFDGCTSMTSVTMGNGVTSIGENGFSNCTRLKTVSIPDSVTTIGSDAFSSCTSLTNATILKGVTKIGSSAFNSCTALKTVTIPSSVTSIGDCAFASCKSLTNVTIPGGVTSIGYAAFRSCTKLSRITISNSNCTIYNDKNTLGVSGSTTIYGHPDSTAQTYANKYGYTFATIYTDADWSEDSIYDQSSGKITLAVYANQKDSDQETQSFKLADTATVTYQDKTYELSKADDGVISFYYTGGSVTVSKEDYVSRTISEAALKISAKVYLQKRSDSCPVISALWLGNVDILSRQYEIPRINSGSSVVTPEIDWGTSSYGSITLLQGTNSVSLTNGANNVNWSNSLDITQDVYIVAKNAAGQSSRRKLKIAVKSAESIAMEGFQLDTGDKLTFALPNKVPLLGGKAISVELPIAIPFDWVVEDGKIYVSIGYQRNYGYDEDTHKVEVKKFAEEAKKLFKDTKEEWSDYKKNQELRKRFGKKLYKGKGSFGFDADFMVVGFMEGYVTPQGNLQWLNRGIIFGGGVGADYSAPFYIGPVPLSFEIEFSAQVQAQLNVIVSNSVRKVTPAGTVDGEISLSGGLGVGIKKVASLSGGLEGKIKPRWEIVANKNDYFKLVGSLNAYAKVEVAFFTYKHAWDPIKEVTWIEYPSQKNPWTAPVSEEFNPYDTSAYTRSDLRYLEDPSEFLPSQRPTRTVENSDIVVTDFLTNAYANAEPQIASFSDGTMLAVWLNGSTNVNALQLYYSYFDGMSWSQPSAVDADGTMDVSASLIAVDNVAYLVWQDASSAISDTATLEDVAPKMGISLATFHKETQKFSVQNVTETVKCLNMMPTVCVSADEVSVVWLRNSENAWFGDNQANTILCRTMTNGTWSEERTLYSGLNSIDSLTANYVDGALSVAYCMDTDGDLSTETDMEAFLNSTQISNNEVLDSGIFYFNGTLYRYQGGAIVDERGAEILKLEADRFQVIDEHGVKAILYNQYNGLYSTIYAVFYDAEANAWGEPIALTANDASYKSFRACVDVNGVLQIFANRIAVNGNYNAADPYGEATLQLITLSLDCDLMITDIYYDCSTYVPGASMTFDLSIKNNGELAANGLAVQIKDEDGVIVSESMLMETLLAGASTEITCGFTPEAVESGKVLTISVIPSQGPDRNEADNSVTATLSFKDIAVENIGWGVNMADEAVIYADIVNRSYDDCNTPVTVHLCASADSTETLQSVSVESLDTMSSERVSFNVAYEEEKVYYIVIETEGENNNSANDSDYVVLNGEASEDNEPILDETIKIAHSLNLASDISINYAVKSSYLTDYDRFHLSYSVPKYTGNEITEYTTGTIEGVVNGSYYYFTLKGLNALRMNDMVEATLHMFKGDVEYVSKVDTYSVGTYAYNKLNDANAAEALKKMCANLLQYGAAAQVWKEYRTNALVDANMTAEHKAYLIDTESITFGTVNQKLGDVANAKVTWVGKALILDSQVAVKYVFDASKFTGDINNLKLVATFTNKDGQKETVTVEEFEVYNEAKKQYAFIFNGLLAAELRAVVNVAIYAGNTQVSESWNFQADQYAIGKDGALLEMCKALFAYSDSAKAYFGN